MIYARGMKDLLCNPQVSLEGATGLHSAKRAIETINFCENGYNPTRVPRYAATWCLSIEHGGSKYCVSSDADWPPEGKWQVDRDSTAPAPTVVYEQPKGMTARLAIVELLEAVPTREDVDAAPALAPYRAEAWWLSQVVAERGLEAGLAAVLDDTVRKAAVHDHTPRFLAEAERDAAERSAEAQGREDEELPAGTKIFVKGHGRGEYVSFERQVREGTPEPLPIRETDCRAHAVDRRERTHDPVRRSGCADGRQPQRRAALDGSRIKDRRSRPAEAHQHRRRGAVWRAQRV